MQCYCSKLPESEKPCSTCKTDRVIRIAKIDYEINPIVKEVSAEVIRASLKHPDLHSLHEGYAVILEELDEVWDEIKKTKNSLSMPDAVRNELIQVAAMAVRMIYNLEAYQ